MAVSLIMVSTTYPRVRNGNMVIHPLYLGGQRWAAGMFLHHMQEYQPSVIDMPLTTNENTNSMAWF